MGSARLWHALHRDREPRTRSRALALGRRVLSGARRGCDFGKVDEFGLVDFRRVETKPELFRRCLSTTRAQCQSPARPPTPLFCAPAVLVRVGVARSLRGPCAVPARSELLWAMETASRWAPVSALVSRACQVGKLGLLGALRQRDVTHFSFEVQEGPRAGQRLLCDLFLSKHLRKSSHQHFGISFKLLESSCTFSPSSPLPSLHPSPLIFPPLSPKVFGNFEAGRAAV